MASFAGHILIRGKIECLTGLHIGSGNETSEIGGVDSFVLRDPRTGYPYIPGSSLKGRMRVLLEYAKDVVGINKKRDGGPHHCLTAEEQAKCAVCRVFGTPADETRTCGPTRLLVRDAYPDEQTVSEWAAVESDLLYTEVKAENLLDRLTSVANPRFIERVLKGSMFDLNMVYGVYAVDEQDDRKFLENVVLALRLLEDSNLGGSGSRGYGQVRLHMAPPVCLSCDDYRTGKAATQRPPASPQRTECTIPVAQFAVPLDQEPLKSWRAQREQGAQA